MRWFLSRRVWFGYGEKSTRTLVSALGNKDLGANICFIDNTDLQTTSVGGKRDRPVRKAHLQSKS